MSSSEGLRIKSTKALLKVFVGKGGGLSSMVQNRFLANPWVSREPKLANYKERVRILVKVTWDLIRVTFGKEGFTNCNDIQIIIFLSLLVSLIADSVSSKCTRRKQIISFLSSSFSNFYLFSFQSNIITTKTTMANRNISIRSTYLRKTYWNPSTNCLFWRLKYSLQKCTINKPRWIRAYQPHNWRLKF